MRGVVPEALVSRKVVYREVCTEGGVSVEMSGGHLEVIDPTVGQTIKSGTDSLSRKLSVIFSGLFILVYKLNMSYL